jgi:hypothetical protein
MIPPLVHPSVRSGAERRLFETIATAANTDDWYCLHSLALARHDTKRRAEIDFLLLTRVGVFVLEVKGGRVSRSGGLWSFTDRWDRTTSKQESPFEQASSAMFALEREVSEHFAKQGSRGKRLFGFGVLFPDIIFDDVGVEGDKRQVYDQRDASKAFSEYVERLAGYWRERSQDGSGGPTRRAPTTKDLESLVSLLRGDFDCVPTLGARAEQAKRDLVSLEATQYSVLDGLQFGHDMGLMPARHFVQGGAGTGKTLLAAEVSRRAATAGSGRVLLLCFNRVLHALLSHHLQSHENIEVKTVGMLFRELVADSPFDGEFTSRAAGKESSEVYATVLPELAEKAVLAGIALKYDCLVVDEAQDMMSGQVLDILDFVVEGGLQDGSWWFFCDINNQASVFGVFEQQALFRLIRHGQVTVLPTNRRNTIPVATETAILARPKAAPPATTEGVPVVSRFYKAADDQKKRLASDLDKLLKQGIAPHQLTVLSPLGENACVRGLQTTLALRQVTQDNAWKVGSPLLDAVTFCTVSSFKGLENDFILLTDVESLATSWWAGVVYVGMSRARVGLYVYLNQTLKIAHDERKQMWLADQVKGINR